MMESRFAIPAEFQSKLRSVEEIDQRTDEEILESLTKYVPITSEKNVWTYWHAGVRAMPAWTQRNITTWVRINAKAGWAVRVLDTVPDSPNNAMNFLDRNLLPETFVKGTMEGPYVGPHSADFLRGAALWQHGGVWLDVGCILIRELDRICWEKLESDSSPFTVSTAWMYGCTMANHFVAARKGDPFIKHWHDLFIYLWRDKTTHEGVINDPLVEFGKHIDFSPSVKRGFAWDFKVEPIVVMNYIGQVLSWLRVCMLEEPNGGFNGRQYAYDHILWFDSLVEDWAAEDTIGYAGQFLFDALKCRTDADPQSTEYQNAYKTIWRILTSASMQKITHGKALTKTPACGVLLDAPGNEDMDLKEGTFFELLRYGQVHFEQTRDDIAYVKGEMPEMVIRKGLLEA